MPYFTHNGTIRARAMATVCETVLTFVVSCTFSLLTQKLNIKLKLTLFSVSLAAATAVGDGIFSQPIFCRTLESGVFALLCFIASSVIIITMPLLALTTGIYVANVKMSYGFLS